METLPIMTAWSAEIANEFIRRAAADERPLTQMQLQKLVYIAHGWNLAVNGEPLTHDAPQAWDYGPVYRDLWQALREFGRAAIPREIKTKEYMPGSFDTENADVPARAKLSQREIDVIDRVYQNYSGFHAFQLSALTHQEGTPWTQVYAGGNGKFDSIDADLIRDHFIGIAAG